MLDSSLKKYRGYRFISINGYGTIEYQSLDDFRLLSVVREAEELSDLTGGSVSFKEEFLGMRGRRKRSIEIYFRVSQGRLTYAGQKSYEQWLQSEAGEKKAEVKAKSASSKADQRSREARFLRGEEESNKKPKTSGRKFAFALTALVVLLVLTVLGVKQGWFGGKNNSGAVTMEYMKDESWDKLTDLEKKRIETLLKEADQYYVTNRLVKPAGKNAYELYNEVLKIHPGNKYALAQLELIKKDFLKRGELEYQRANYDQAINIALSGLSYFEGDGQLKDLLNKSKLQKKIKQLERQAQALAKQKKYITPQDNNAYALCQKILQLDGTNRVAKEILKEIEAWFAQHGQQAEQQKDWAQAVQLYSQALEYFKDNKNFQQRLAQSRQALQQQQFRAKIEDLLARARQQLNSGRYEAAWQTYGEVLKLSPDEQRAREGQNDLINQLEQKARRAFDAKDYTQAITAYALLNRLKPSSAYVQALQRARQGAEAERQKWLNWIDWVWVEGGTFKMGCTSEQSGCDSDEKPVHTVTVDGFYMSKYEVTVAQFAAFIKATGYKTDAEKEGYSWIWDGGWKKKNAVNWRCDVKGNIRPKSEYNHPVIYVSWNDAVAFCKWLSQKMGTTIRLPTEAEWEYAARGGQKSRGYQYAGSNDVDAVAWYWNNSGKKTHPVGQKQPNELGLYDMSGNVYEWCLDWYDSDYYSRSPRNNPRGPSGGTRGVLRGGSWFNNAGRGRVANRSYNDPYDAYSIHGFRILRTQ